MKHLILSFFAGFFIILNTNAQTNYKAGYIVNLEGDTLKGEVDYREWSVNPTLIKFRSQNTTRVIDVIPESSKGFGLNGFEYYRTATTTFSKNPIQVAALSTIIDTARITGTAFLKIIASGQNVTLYSFTDNIKQRFFVSEGTNGRPEELLYQLYIVNGRVQKVKTFTRQLQKFAALYQPRDQDLLRKIQLSDYTFTDIRKLIYSINGIAIPKESFKANGGAVRFFAGIGVQRSTNNADLTADAADIKKGQSSSPTLTGGFDLLSNRNIGRLIFRTELSLSTNKIDVTYTTYANTPSIRYLAANQYIVNITPQLLYNFYNADDLKVYGSAGPNFSFRKYTNKVNRYENYVNDVLIRSVDEKFPQEQNFTFNFNARMGVILKNHFDIYLGYSPPSRIINFPGYGVTTSTFRLGINYLFGKK